MRERVLELRAEAVKLERQADELEAAGTPKPPKPVDPAKLELVERVHAHLRRQRLPKSSTQIADCLGITTAQARQALEPLTEQGIVRRTGLKRGTRYQLASKAAPLALATLPEPLGQRWHERVRDKACELETFTVDDMREAMPGLSDQTLYRWLSRLVKDGVLTVERVGLRNLYAYVPPVDDGVPEAAKRLRLVTPEQSARRAYTGQVSGTGKGTRGGGAVVNALLREVRGFPGVTVERRSHKYAFKIDGVEVASCSTTPGASSLKQTRSHLRKAGVPV